MTFINFSISCTAKINQNYKGKRGQSRNNEARAGAAEVREEDRNRESLGHSVEQMLRGLPATEREGRVKGYAG